MKIATEQVLAILEPAVSDGRSALLETEGIALLDALGVRTPAHRFVSGAADVGELDLSFIQGPRAVVKVISPDILHKSDVGGVAIVDNDGAAIAAAVGDMASRFRDRNVIGFTVHDFLPYDHELGNELLVGLRWTDDFGPVVAVGTGGIHTEFLSGELRPGGSVAAVSPAVPPRGGVEAALERTAVVRLATREMRGRPAPVAMARITDVVERVAALAEHMPHRIRELEVNPLVVHDGELWALDALVKLGDGTPAVETARPVHKLTRLLEPRSIAVIGVSSAMNPGHVILCNMIRDGFDRGAIRVVKPGADEIEGCRCVPDIASLPERVDLFVLAIDAAQAANAVAEIVEGRKAESIIVIPGGLEEKSGSEETVSRMRTALAASRESDWGGPLVNGGNCLGIRSRPGRYDTMFIPDHKIGFAPPRGVPVAFISQSGAFAVSKNSKLASVDMTYSISVGNQMDVTVGDYLDHLSRDERIELFAVYLEGFKPLDGRRFLEAARRITESGRSMVLYRAGRTAEGARATASHTASVAGDYAVTRELAAGAGVVVADTIADFEDLVMLLSLLRGKRVGRRLGAVSNAGFECVAIADNTGPFELARFADTTRDRIGDALRAARIDGIVDVRNPVDLTPMMGDEMYEAVVRAVLDDPGVDVGVVGCVPLTPALNTLPAGDGHNDDVASDTSIASRFARIVADHPKACVVAVDGGAGYDPMARMLTRAGVPTFRTIDRALRLLGASLDSLPAD